jgi:DNA-binding GntR family transcriptional regulator
MSHVGVHPRSSNVIVTGETSPVNARCLASLLMDTASYTEAPTVPSSPLRRDQVYGELRRRLMLGEFPVQSRLVEERIAATLGVSRTPVREALVRLLTDGLVHRTDGGYYVALPDFTKLRDLYDLRITLELRGLARAVESDAVRHDASLLEPLRDQWRAMQADQPEPAADFVCVDEDFHVTLLRASGNPALTETLEAVNARIRPVRMYDFLTRERIALTVSQHLAVVEAVLADRLDDAVAALHHHVGESMEVVERRAAHAITQMALHKGVPT